MGSRNSKQNPKSYDIAPVVSNKDFSYQRTPKTLPEVKLPTPKDVTTATTQNNDPPPATLDNATAVPEIQQIQITSAAVELDEAEKPNNKSLEAEIQQITLAAAEIADAEKPAKSQDEVTDPRIPSWVNEEHFKPLLSKLYPNFKQITSFKAKPALAPGENYATLMLRVYLTIELEDGSTNDLSYMLKVAHDNKEMMEMLKHNNFFDVENAVYNKVLPDLEEMYSQAGVKVEFGAKAYKLAPEAPISWYVLLEDLSVRGFKNVNRLECLDMEHTLAVLRKLAQFHAASVCHEAANGSYVKDFSPDLNNPQGRAMITQMFSSFKKPFMDNLKTYENGEKYEEAFDKFFDHAVEEFMHTRTPHPTYMNVLTHGDSWSNNILFNYTEDGKLNEVLLVDFQNTHYSPLAQDLFYFIISSTQIDIKTSQFDYFISYYHQHLAENLRLLKYADDKIPTLRELHLQIMEYGTFAAITSFFTMAIVLLDPTDNAKFENFLGEEAEGANFKNALFSNPRYHKHINVLLPWFANRGFLETHDLDNKTIPVDNSTEITTTPAVSTPSSEFSYPEWLNEAYFDDIIRADCENYQQILKFIVSPATNSGDNFSSIMLKVDIDVQLADNSSQNRSYLVKIPPTDPAVVAIMGTEESFTKEINAYNEIIKNFEKVFKDNADIEVVFGPKSFKPTIDNGCATLILENLSTKNFKNCDRLQGLDKSHTEAVLKKLAQFHAASAYVFETQGNYADIYERSKYTEKLKEAMKKSGKEFLDMHYSCMLQYEGNEEYREAVKNYLDNSIDYMAKADKIDSTKFNVLNHGDCWTNNIMFQYDDKGDITNTYFVDFQLMKYGSPAQDIYYFLLTSPKLEYKMEYFDYFVRYYHDNLSNYLKLLKYPKEIPTLKELHVELLEKGTFALNACTGGMTVVLLDPFDNADIKGMMSSDKKGLDLRLQMVSNPRYRSHVELLYPWMLRRGLLDFD